MTSWWANAAEYEPYQAIRILHREAGEVPVVGFTERPESDPIRFTSAVSFGFPTSDIGSVTADEHGRPRVEVHWLGVVSPTSKGALPAWYAMLLLEAERNGNRGMRAFFDLFNHRLASLQFRAWLKHNLPIRHELERRGVVQRLLLSLLGLGTDSLPARLRLDPRAILRHPAAFLRRPATPAALVLVLQSYFGMPVAVDSFVSRMLPLDPDQQLRLDGTRGLGVDTVLGQSVRTAQGSFRLRVGPIGYAAFLDFLPGGRRLAELQQLVRFLVGAEYDYDVQLELREAQVPKLRLGGSVGGQCRLGWSGWLGERLQGGNARDTLVPAASLEGTSA